MELLNNALFWQKIESLFFSSEIVIDRPKNSTEPKFSDLLYPVDCGYIKEGTGESKNRLEVFVGSKKSKSIEYIIVAVDILKKEIDIKLIWGCSEEEIKEILFFLNSSDFQKTILVKKGKDIPTWAENWLLLAK